MFKYLRVIQSIFQLTNQLHHFLDALLCDGELGKAESQVAALASALRKGQADQQALRERVSMST
jgi:hypothetical protein